MAWFYTEIRFAERQPSLKELGRINELLLLLDDECPAITELGMQGFWRHPLLQLEQLMSVLHAFGYACEGHSLRWDWAEEEEDEVQKRIHGEPWLSSTTELSWANDGGMQPMKRRLLSFSRRFRRFM